MSFKIAFIGAGSLVFARTLFTDIISVPEFHDIEIAFTAKFLNYCIDTCAVHTYACTNCIYIRIVAPYSDLCTGTGLTCDALDLNSSVFYFCNF